MTIHTSTITIIGAGNMARALVSGIIANGHPPDKLWVANPSTPKLEALKSEFAISISTENTVAAEKADILIFAVKPKILPAVAKELAPLIQKRRPLIISVVTGIPIASLQQWLGQEQAIVRCMPNTPASLGCGATGLYANPATSTEQRQLAEAALASVGFTVWLDQEAQLDAVTALSGSGPAYFYLFMEILQQVGQDLGLPEETARLLTLHTAYGATIMAVESQQSLPDLRRHVTSPGGTTEAAVETLEKGGLRGLIEKALLAARQRAEELSRAS